MARHRASWALVALAAVLMSSLSLLASADTTVDAAAAGAGPGEVKLDAPSTGGAAAGGEPAAAAGETFSFQAEVSRVMEIIIHSLYSNRDIFVRELISNASDALDKIRFLALSDGSQLGSGDAAALEIRVRADKAARTLTLRDRGVGMTRAELIANLGTIAKSGTRAFIDKLSSAKGDSSNLIGQFGVGFYSAYLVADRVTVRTKHNDEPALYVWESGADQTFTIREETTGTPPERGTELTLHLKEDAGEYLETAKLKELIQKYSQFINFPIYLEVAEEVEVPIESPAEDEEATKEGDEAAVDEAAEKAKEETDEMKVEDGEDAKADDAKDAEKETPKTKKETVFKWELVNEHKPIWTRDSAEVTDAEYDSFFNTIAKLPGKPLAKTHFKAEGDVDFRSILYVPDKPPVNLYNNAEAEKDAIKMYVRRVLVTDKFEFGLLPRYLGFLIGIVDSDDLPINVSREMLQQSKTLSVIKRKLVRKALDMIRGLSEKKANDAEQSDEGEEVDMDKPKESTDADAADKKSDADEADKKPDPYLTFWKAYGKSIKLGVIEDEANKERLAKLLRFQTSKTNASDEADWASLDDYLERMKEDQEYIYYSSGESVDAIKRSPFLERLLEKDYEVLYLYEPIDEHMALSLPNYQGSKLMSAEKDNFKFGDKDQKDAKERLDGVKSQFRPLTKFLKTSLGDKVSKVRLSTRLSSTPCVLSTEQWGYSARMEIIMKAQAFSDPDSYKYMMPKAKVMEIHPGHPLIRKLLDLVVEDDQSTEAAELAHLVYDTALVSSGFLMQDNSDFATRMYKMLRKVLGWRRARPSRRLNCHPPNRRRAGRPRRATTPRPVTPRPTPTPWPTPTRWPTPWPTLTPTLTPTPWLMPTLRPR
eukprot:TRINITY_DN1684_c0_g1_i2.p1 TRINITY_DN1684_c0_g1~~TRINITY_DN1684_c0_g1_i2.p1  ORF type:complete len:877 (-),score=435.12 TRINITY_DN1684_c0_g1_i2:189-2819(-)